MGEVAHLGHEAADGGLIEAGVLVGPVVLVAETPENDRWVVTVLIDHVGEHIFGVLLEGLAADAGAAPGGLLPDHQAELVAEVEDEAVLLVVGEADEVRAHGADEAELFADEVVGHGGGDACVVGMARGAAEEDTLAVELEWAVVDEFDVADAEALVELGLASGGGEGDAAGVEVGGIGRPEFGSGDGEGGELGEAGPRGGGAG